MYLENFDPNKSGNRFEDLYNQREKSANRMKEITNKVMKEEGCSFAPKTNKKVNSQLVSNDVIYRNTEFLTKKNEKLQQYIKNQENEFQYAPNLVSRQYQSHSIEKLEPFQDRLYNNAMEVEMKKERLRREQVNDNCTFKPKLAKMTDQILISKSMFANS